MKRSRSRPRRAAAAPCPARYDSRSRAARDGAAALLGSLCRRQHASVVGTGTLTLSLGDESFTSTIDRREFHAGRHSRCDQRGVGQPRRARNADARRATAARLVLTSAETGAANAITVTPERRRRWTLARSRTARRHPANYTEIAEAQDAHRAHRECHSDQRHQRRSTGAIDGVYAEPRGSEAGRTTETLTVGFDERRGDDARQELRHRLQHSSPR